MLPFPRRLTLVSSSFGPFVISHPAALSFEEDVTLNFESDAKDAVVKDIRHPGAPIMDDVG
jgi:hypothetical protein